MGTKRIIVGSIIVTFGILTWYRMLYEENGLLSNSTNSTSMINAMAKASDPSTMLAIFIVAVSVAIGSVILASGIRSALFHN